MENENQGLTISYLWGDSEIGQYTLKKHYGFKVPTELILELMSIIERHEHPFDKAPKISPRLIDVLELVARNYYLREIAEELGISIHTINKHMSALKEAFQVETTGALLYKATILRVLSPTLMMNMRVSHSPPPALPDSENTHKLEERAADIYSDIGDLLD